MSLLLRMLKEALQVHPLGVAGLAALALVSSLLPAVELWLTGRIVDELAAVLGEGQAAFLQVLPWVGGFFGTLFAYMLLDMARAILQVDVQEKIGVRIQRRVIDKVQKVELASFEHPAFYDALKRANEDLSGRLLSLLNVVLDVIGSLCRCASSRCPSAIREVKRCSRRSIWKFVQASGSRWWVKTGPARRPWSS